MQPIRLQNTIPATRAIDPVRLKSDLLLGAAALVWGAGFIAQRVASLYIGVFVFNGSRFLLGSLILFVLSRGVLRYTRSQLPWIVGAGAILFIASAFQQAGLTSTSVGNTGFITGLYVVLVPILEWVIWRIQVRWTTWIAVALAVFGTTLLGGGGRLSLGKGDLLVLVGSLFWAIHVIVVGQAARRMPPQAFSMGQFFFAGLFHLIAGLLFETSTLPGMKYAWGAVLFSAVFPICTGFTLQAIGQKNAPTLDAALILSLEAVFASIFGVIFLGETYQLTQWAGALLILTSIILAQIFTLPSSTPASEPEDEGAAGGIPS